MMLSGFNDAAAASIDFMLMPKFQHIISGTFREKHYNPAYVSPTRGWVPRRVG
jgi:hypothetical protein